MESAGPDRITNICKTTNHRAKDQSEYRSKHGWTAYNQQQKQRQLGKRRQTEKEEEEDESFLSVKKFQLNHLNLLQQCFPKKSPSKHNLYILSASKGARRKMIPSNSSKK